MSAALALERDALVLRERYPVLTRIPSPATGQELVVTVPGGVIWIPRVLRFTYTASAAVANRFIRLFIDDGSTTFWSWSDPNALTAGQSHQVNVTPQVTAAQQSGSDRYYVIPRVQLPAGHRIFTVTLARDALDQISAVTFYGIEISSRPVAQELMAQLASLSNAPDDFAWES